MKTWEYVATTWGFAGPGRDPWPGAEAYMERLIHAIEGDSGAVTLGTSSRLESDDDDPAAAEYRQWRNDAENDYLNEMGKAGFELVTLHRDVMSTSAAYWSVVSVRAYFKRERGPDQPDIPPNPIGFMPPT